MYSPKEILADDGPVAKQLNGFSAREAQQEMAEVIFSAICDHQSVLCEAGTGTGKTFSYLVPALLSNQKIILSTGTKHLQDQLFFKDLPIIQKAVGHVRSITLLKGRSNYLCRYHLQQYIVGDKVLPDSLQAQMGAVVDWANMTKSGEFDELANLTETTPLRPLLASTIDNCLANACEHFSECFILRARQCAQQADVVIVNHHLFLADMVLKDQGFGEILPTADTIIFDEAHQLPGLIPRFFSRSLSSGQMDHLLQDSRHLLVLEGADRPAIDTLMAKAESKLHQYLKLAKTINAGNKLDFSDLLAVLQPMIDMLAQHAASNKMIANYYQRALSQFDFIETYMKRQSDDCTYWLESIEKGFCLYQTPINAATSFAAQLDDNDINCVFTSATLSVSGNFSHFTQQLGLLNSKGFVWDSPFDFLNRTLLYLPGDLPDPRQLGFLEQFIGRVAEVLYYSKGRAFILFTSHQSLKVAAKLLAKKTSFPLLVQGQAPKMTLIERFKKIDQAVLLGTQSFWEGVDIKGSKLCCVMIDKLPFQSPEDPLLRSRLALLQKQGHNPFIDYQLPQAIIGLKQGVGRLIRGTEDWGVLMIGDRRLVDKPYGRRFIEALPKMPITDSLKKVEDFFASH